MRDAVIFDSIIILYMFASISRLLLLRSSCQLIFHLRHTSRLFRCFFSRQNIHHIYAKLPSKRRFNIVIFILANIKRSVCLNTYLQHTRSRIKYLPCRRRLHIEFMFVKMLLIGATTGRLECYRSLQITMPIGFRARISI